MAAQKTTTRRSACETRRALVLAPLAAALAGPIRPADTYVAKLSLPVPQDWSAERAFLGRFHVSGAAAVAAAEATLAHPDDCQGVILGEDRVLRILLPGGIAVSQLGVEVSA